MATAKSFYMLRNSFGGWDEQPKMWSKKPPRECLTLCSKLFAKGRDPGRMAIYWRAYWRNFASKQETAVTQRHIVRSSQHSLVWWESVHEQMKHHMVTTGSCHLLLLPGWARPPQKQSEYTSELDDAGVLWWLGIRHETGSSLRGLGSWKSHEIWQKRAAC